MALFKKPICVLIMFFLSFTHGEKIIFYCFSNNDTLITYMRRYRKFRQGVGVWMGSISDNFFDEGRGDQIAFRGGLYQYSQESAVYSIIGPPARRNLNDVS